MAAINFFVSADPKESSEKRVMRFKQWYNRSRVNNLVKEGRYHQRALTKRQVRQAALKREAYRAVNEKNKFYQ